MKRRCVWVGLLVVGIGIGGCGDTQSAPSAAYLDTGCRSEVAGGAALGGPDPFARPERPLESTFCLLALGTSTLEDVERVLGVPRFSHDDGGGSLHYTYDYARGQTLRLSFRDGRLQEADVANMPRPACWQVQP